MASSRAADPSALARRPTESTLAWAHRLASSAEELHEHGKFGQAATHFEAASDAYISATLDTSDTHNMQSLRLLASAHANRAHELRLRMRLHGVRAAAGDANADGTAQSTPQAVRQPQAEDTAVAGSAFAQVASQLISTNEELRFGADELVRLLLTAGLVQPSGASQQQAIGGSGGMSSSTILNKTGTKGAQLIDSFLVTPPLHAYAGAAASSSNGGASFLATSQALQPPPQQTQPAFAITSASSRGGGGGAGSSAANSGGGVNATSEDGPESLRAALSQMSLEQTRLTRENATLKQRNNELSAILGKAQRRAADQQRLARKALTALREAQAKPRPELTADAAKEIRDLYKQLNNAHNKQRQQGELVKKYEQRWAQLKASARKKQALQAAEKAAGGGSSMSRLKDEVLYE